MAAPTNGILSSFTQADGAPANFVQGITAYSVPPTASNELTWPQFPSLIWNPSSFNADQEAFAQIKTHTGSMSFSLLLRWTNPNSGAESGISVHATPDAPQFAEAFNWVGGVGTLISYSNFIMDPGDIWMWATVIGTTLSLYGGPDGLTWTLRTTWTTSVTDAGKIGLFNANNGAGPYGTLDNFGGGSVISPAFPMKRRRSRGTSWV